MKRQTVSQKLMYARRELKAMEARFEKYVSDHACDAEDLEIARDTINRLRDRLAVYESQIHTNPPLPSTT